MAAKLGISTTLVSQVLAGNKIFTPEQAQILIIYLNLNGIERDYFVYMNQKERAGNQESKNYWNQKMQELSEKALKVANRVQSNHTLTDLEKSIFYSDITYSCIRIYTSIGQKGKSLDEIRDRFKIPDEKLDKILDFLVQTSLIYKNGNQYTIGTQKTHLGVDSVYNQVNLKNWRLHSIEKAKRLSTSELMYSCSASLSRSDFTVLREEMVQFIKTFLDKIHDSEAEDLACFSLDFFWID
jgi:uncharacterized protein (TIGR02147 family)